MYSIHTTNMNTHTYTHTIGLTCDLLHLLKMASMGGKGSVRLSNLTQLRRISEAWSPVFDKITPGLSSNLMCLSNWTSCTSLQCYQPWHECMQYNMPKNYSLGYAWTSTYPTGLFSLETVNNTSFTNIGQTYNQYKTSNNTITKSWYNL